MSSLHVSERSAPAGEGVGVDASGGSNVVSIPEYRVIRYGWTLYISEGRDACHLFRIHRHLLSTSRDGRDKGALWHEPNVAIAQ
jgi:hypothetical protein